MSAILETVYLGHVECVKVGVFSVIRRTCSTFGTLTNQRAVLADLTQLHTTLAAICIFFAFEREATQEHLMSMFVYLKNSIL